MLEGRDHRQFLVLHTEAVGRKRFGKGFGLDAHFLLNECAVSAEKRESFELVFDLLDA